MRRLLLLSLLAVVAMPALAQQQRRPAAPPPPPPPKEEAAPEPPPAAYEPDLLRLAEVLGTLSYMTALCTQPGSDTWPQRITQLIEAEGTTPQRKERLAGAYNRGYLGHQSTHRACTERSRQIIDRQLQQGQRLTREISTRYSG
jgi:uncharacterized protein (TIGR02301 family)